MYAEALAELDGAANEHLIKVALKPLRDRVKMLEIDFDRKYNTDPAYPFHHLITIPGYLETEKECIATDFLLPRQLEQHGLKLGNLILTRDAILEIIRRYTCEAGVRGLERELASICRKVARTLFTIIHEY